ncbi:hypothetical protein [Petroclostridium sp. X23]|uniref:hypothetical protein n=1 Tax=Petroclostridium sp. X23 TaxID=3045146 RepID=UPI0024AE5C4E|nr:hypothetical protein [Petroclostridium sp. X23]WHH59459.1 hypothetical protein QKW49_01445 [Petroclostridium sp. X23]
MVFKSIKNLFSRLSKLNIINKKFERFLALLSSIFVFTLIISQIGLFNETTRTFFTDIDRYEGVDINDLDEVFKKGQVTVKLINTTPDANIKILLNGTVEYDFTEETAVIDVRNNCIIEIDGTKVEVPFKVQIVNTSDNIMSNCNGKEIEIDRNIGVLARIFLK